MTRPRTNKPWSKDLPWRVATDSMWKRRDDRTGERWKVTARYHFEISSLRLMRAVRIHCFGGYSDGMVRHMSEDRLLRSFVAITEKDLANRRRR